MANKHIMKSKSFRKFFARINEEIKKFCETENSLQIGINDDLFIVRKYNEPYFPPIYLHVGEPIIIEKPVLNYVPKNDAAEERVLIGEYENFFTKRYNRVFAYEVSYYLYSRFKDEGIYYLRIEEM